MSDISSPPARRAPEPQSSGAGEQAKDKSQDAQEKVQQGAEQAKNRVREQVEQRSNQAGEQVTATASALRTTGEKLRADGNEPQAKAADRAAEQAEKLGSYLSESNADRILSDVEDFGRRQPLAAVAAGIGLGFAAARFLKASSRQRYGQSRPSAGNGTLPPASRPRV